mgnify:CR=1 FL=1|tara:strand:- start:1425 stop:1937 length:513 start_codon:yes stop_codon:yes gene_type:complete
MVTHVQQQAMWPKPHNFIQLTFSNSPGTDRNIADLYVKGNSFRDIEKLLGISKTKVRDTLIRLEIPIRPTFEETQRATQVRSGKKNVKPPYGFVYFEGRVVKHPKEYPVLLSIINRWKADQSLNSIATKLNEKRVPSPMGKCWSWNSIDNIVKRIKNGHLVQNGDQYELR